MIFVGTICTKQQLQWRNEVGIQNHTHRKDKQGFIVRLQDEPVQSAAACQLGTQSEIGHPADFWKMYWHHKERLCVGRETGIGRCFPLGLRGTIIESRTPVDQNGNNNNFVSPGNDTFPHS